MPFGLKVPSKNTLIFSGVAGGIAAQDARARLAQRVSFLADRPCGVHEMPRKVTVYITAPPGGGLEKSRTWFREYVKPILVAGAVDYEIKEAKSPGQIETSVMEEIVQRLREAAEAAESASNAESTDHEQLENKSNTGFTTPVNNMSNKKKSEVVSDGILGIGRNAYREVLCALGKGWDYIIAVFVEVRLLEVLGHRKDKG
ncbi:mitochondrial import inner membrane translocase subunit Tim54 [Mucor mucedo]|uniref:mitochondrial import inner membrane translocase subunit Tim54 n=1 Tax=Mucor mucedo TaxID=29922 RepID=UPI00221FA759|nr:mitochondrial import inner membrane translocase subunit Tim54 [Mucor mucedo]KAI7891360.1 mitochondrial import inner membrane translocase subunit Tim54 [Mucor mucedo]